MFKKNGKQKKKERSQEEENVDLLKGNKGRNKMGKRCIDIGN